MLQAFSTNARVLIALGLLATAGCAGNSAPAASSSMEQAQVKGKVTLGGKALGKVQVRFNPANTNRKTAPTAIAETNQDGTYELTTLRGENAVSVGGKPLVKKPQYQYFSKTFDVQSGSNSFDIELR
ncbi:hypothetical protein [Singulisphaera sp. PoT]|uniref:hypothetical protein n=1 Tax=Singulisphaera sp. PoT TaxID=3411797 RepID=UPI003BF5A0BA